MLQTLPFLLVAGPLCIIAAVNDLKTMKIPNWISIVLFAVFLPLGLLLLPFDEFLWRLLATVILFVIVFVMNAVGLIGGGDAKLAAAFTPYIATHDYGAFLFVMAVAGILTLVAHRIAGRIPAIRNATPEWKSWTAGNHFPYGLTICVTAIYYLIHRVMVVA